MEYYPSSFIPTDPAQLSGFLRNELQKLQEVLSAAQKTVVFLELHAAPTKTYEGMMVLADGTNWDPGQGGGYYAFLSGIWVKFAESTGSSGTVTDVSVVSANGVSGTVATSTTTPAITLTLGNITPSSVTATGNVTGANLSGTNTGDQTITLTGDVTGSGTGSFAATIANQAVTYAKVQNVSATARLLGRYSSGAGTIEEITLGSGLSLSGSGELTATSGSGSVTSVGLSMPSIFSVSGSPVTTSGTLTASLQNQSANTGFFGPSSGSPSAPAFRAMETSDIPNSGVTYSKIQDVAALSVIGRSGNTSGVTAAITATSGSQFLKSNSAGNSIIFETLSSSDVTTALGFTPGAGTVTSVTGGDTNAISVTTDVSSPNPVVTATLTTNFFSNADNVSFMSFSFASQTLSVTKIDLSDTNNFLQRLQISNLQNGNLGTVLASGTLNPEYTFTPTLGQASTENGTLGLASINGGVVTIKTPTDTNFDFSIGKSGTGFQLSAGTGPVALTVGANADVSGTNTGDQTITLTGDVTGSGTGSFAATIANLAVTNAKIANSTIDLTTKVTGILPGANGGTGVANTGLTINLGSGGTGKVLTSDSLGNGTWSALSSLGVTSISGTTNQINVSPTTGAAVASLSSTIVTPGTLSVNGSLRSNSSTTVNATGAYNFSIRGTQTSDTGSNFAQSSIVQESILSPANNIATLGGVSGYTNLTKIIAASTKTIGLGSNYYGRPDASSNVGTITKLVTFYGDTAPTASGTASGVYQFYGKDPNTGTVSQAAYFDNLSVGYDAVDLKTTNKAIFAGNVSIGSSSTTSLFNVGSSNQFQINSSGDVVAGGWLSSSKIGLAYGGTNSDLSATGGSGQYLKQSSAGAAISVGTIPASDIASGAALTKADDTNVTLTLGGSPSTSLLAATSLTLGWTGQLSVARGGTGQAFYTNGQLLIGNTTGNTLTKSTLTGTSNQVIVTNGAGSITLSLPQDIATSSNVRFGSIGVGVAALNATDISGAIAVGSYAGVNTAPSNSIIASGGIGAKTTSFNSSSIAIQSGNSSSSTCDIAIDGAASSEKRILFYSGGSGKWVVGTAGSTDVFDVADFGSGASRFAIDKTTGYIGIGTTNPSTKLTAYEFKTLAANLTDGEIAGLTLWPEYSGAFTVTRHNYLKCLNPTLTSTTLTDAAVIRFDAAAGTHKAIDSGTTKTSPGTVSAWMKININGTIYYIPAYTSKTS